MRIRCSIPTFALYSLGMVVLGVAAGFVLLGETGLPWGIALATGVMLVIASTRID